MADTHLGKLDVTMSREIVMRDYGRRRWIVLCLGLLLCLDPAARAVITRLTPLREVLNSEQLIFTVKVAKLDPDKPAVIFQVEEDLKGKATFRKLPVNLTADSEGQREQHTPKLLKRLADELELVIFASKRGKRYTAFGYTNGTWFQLIGQAEDDSSKVRWSFTHCEPYLRRTFKGTTEELKQVVRDGLAGKKKPPEPDAKEEPGLGPEVKAKEKVGDKRGQTAEHQPEQGGHSVPPTVLSTRYSAPNATTGPLVAVIPTFVIVGPLALLATLFPAVFGGLALLMRRWIVLLSIASLNSTLYLAHAWFSGYLGGSWWGTPAAMWATMTVLTLLGVAWSWRRNRAWARANPAAASQPPQRSELIILGTVSVTGLLIVLYCLARGTLFSPPWKDLIVIWSVAWVGALYTLLLRWRANRQIAARSAPATEGIMLWALVFACAGLGFTSIPRQTEGAAQVVWAFEPPEPGAIISSPLVAGDHIYIGAIHSSGLSSYGAMYCLDRHTGQQVWKFDDDGGLLQVFSTPCLAEGRLFFGEGLHENRGCRFFCLNADTGKETWHFETTSHTESSPCAAGGLVFFGAGDDGMYALDAATGKERWHFTEPLHVDANPLVVGDRLYCGSGTSRTHKTTQIFCLDATSGKTLWRQPTQLACWGSPATDGTRVYFGLGNGRMDRSAEPPETPAGMLLCVDPADGKEMWHYAVGDGVLVKPVADEQHVYFAARDHHCYCLSKDSGKLLWRKEVGSPVVAAPAVLDNHLYVAASKGMVYCLSCAGGEAIWPFDVAAHSQSRPQIYSSPAAIREEGQAGSKYHLFVGAGLEGALNSKAVLYCLEGPR
jgi:outer membrane protein assembly factor BamB